MPNKKDTVLINKRPVAKRHLLSSKLMIYKNFKKDHPSFTKSFSTLTRLIPKNYRSLNTTCRRVCICCKDYNLKQTVDVLNKLASYRSLPELKSTPRHLSDMSLCPFQDRPERLCIERECESCGPEAVMSMYTPLVEKCSETEKVKFY